MIDVQKRDDEHPKPEPEEEKPKHVHPPMIGLPIPVISAEYLQEKLRERNETRDSNRRNSPVRKNAFRPRSLLLPNDATTTKKRRR